LCQQTVDQAVGWMKEKPEDICHRKGRNNKWQKENRAKYPDATQTRVKQHRRTECQNDFHNTNHHGILKSVAHGEAKNIVIEQDMLVIFKTDTLKKWAGDS
jgi:hypothetical protein